MPRSRFSIALYLILVFASGVLVGVVSHRLYATSSASANNSPQNVNVYRQHFLSGMRTRVGASEQQMIEITKTLDDTEKKFADLTAKEQPLHNKIQQDYVASIRAILNDKQKIEYDNWRAERQRAKDAAAKKSK